MILDTFFNESNIFGYSGETNYVDDIEAIPLGENEHPVDACYRLTLENEQNWFNIMNTLAVSEMAFLEAHDGDTYMMYEAVDIKKIVNTVVDWIKKQFAKLKGVFEKAINKIKEALNFDKKLIKKYDAKVKSNPSIASKTFPIFPIKNNRIVDFDEINKIFDIIRNSYDSKCASEINKMSGDSEKLGSWDKDSRTGMMDEVRGEIVSKMGGASGSCSAKDYSDELKKAITYEAGPIRATDAYDTIKKGKPVASLNANFKKVSVVFNNMIKEAKALEKIHKLNDEKDKSKEMDIKIDALKQMVNINNATSRIVIKTVGTSYSAMRSVLRMAIGEKDKDNDDNSNSSDNNTESTNESVICTII